MRFNDFAWLSLWLVVGAGCQSQSTSRGDDKTQDNLVTSQRVFDQKPQQPIDLNRDIVPQRFGTTMLGEPCQSTMECIAGAFCADGVCCDSVCGGSVTNDCQACSKDRGAATDGVCGPILASANFPCRGLASTCDIIEYCDGTNITCPADVIKADGDACINGGNCENNICILDGWDCNAAFYDELSNGFANVYCHCGCGLWDPDCDSVNTIVGCGLGATCENQAGQGVCVGGSTGGTGGSGAGGSGGLGGSGGFSGTGATGANGGGGSGQGGTGATGATGGGGSSTGGQGGVSGEGGAGGSGNLGGSSGEAGSGTAGTAGTTSGSGAGQAGSAAVSPPPSSSGDDGGCGCRVVQSQQIDGRAAVLLGAVAWFFCLRRRVRERANG